METLIAQSLQGRYVYQAPARPARPAIPWTSEEVQIEDSWRKAQGLPALTMHEVRPGFFALVDQAFGSDWEGEQS